MNQPAFYLLLEGLDVSALKLAMDDVISAIKP